MGDNRRAGLAVVFDPAIDVAGLGRVDLGAEIKGPDEARAVIRIARPIVGATGVQQLQGRIPVIIEGVPVQLAPDFLAVEIIGSGIFAIAQVKVAQLFYPFTLFMGQCGHDALFPPRIVTANGTSVKKGGRKGFVVANAEADAIDAYIHRIAIEDIVIETAQVVFDRFVFTFQIETAHVSVMIGAVVMEIACIFKLRLDDPHVIEMACYEQAGPLGGHDQALMEVLRPGFAAEAPFAVEKTVIAMDFQARRHRRMLFCLYLLIQNQLVRRSLFGGRSREGATE